MASAFNMAPIFCVILFASGLSSASAALKWSSCAPRTADVKILGISLTPNPPVRGKPVAIAVQGTVNSPIANGIASYLVKYNNKAVLLNSKLNICTAGVKCPIKAGPITLKTSLTVPKYAPVGLYTLGVSAVTLNKVPILCINATFTI
eukprot:TRINITY_DN5996_c0_g1_i1.p1 TRINITY_DN5996_c0_g1~~TRINITY_DN5996_c0_g1_i1.p1  ORF type:complete len:148 (+),score=17.77 TRINITY_DN5996_c0_g1_i1:277-720(+)